MPVERWYQAPRKLVLLVLAVTLIPAVGLVRLTMELVEKDRSLEQQHARERLERLADRTSPRRIRDSRTSRTSCITSRLLRRTHH